MESIIQPGMLVAAENILSQSERRTLLHPAGPLLVPGQNQIRKKRVNDLITLRCKATPIGIELKVANTKSKKKSEEIVIADVLPAFEAQAFILDDEMTMRIIHHLAPESRTTEMDHVSTSERMQQNPNVSVGLDASTLIPAEILRWSVRVREARTTMTK